MIYLYAAVGAVMLALAGFATVEHYQLAASRASVKAITIERDQAADIANKNAAALGKLQEADAQAMAQVKAERDAFATRLKFASSIKEAIAHVPPSTDAIPAPALAVALDRLRAAMAAPARSQDSPAPNP